MRSTINQVWIRRLLQLHLLVLLFFCRNRQSVAFLTPVVLEHLALSLMKNRQQQKQHGGLLLFGALTLSPAVLLFCRFRRSVTVLNSLGCRSPLSLPPLLHSPQLKKQCLWWTCGSAGDRRSSPIRMPAQRQQQHLIKTPLCEQTSMGVIST